LAEQNIGSVNERIFRGGKLCEQEGDRVVSFRVRTEARRAAMG
jgi:hypothetical protein